MNRWLNPFLFPETGRKKDCHREAKLSRLFSLTWVYGFAFPFFIERNLEI
jgi:hypothetical protein